MLTDLNMSVTDISPEALDALFNSTPDSTPTADTLVIGKDAEGVATVPIPSDDSIPTIDLDTLPDAEEEGDEEVEETEEKEGNEEDKPEPKKKASPAPKAEDKDEPADAAVSGVLKNTVNYLIEKGIWKDFEGREDLELTEELYAEISEAQNEAKAEERYLAKKESAGDYGQAILDFIEDGGDPDLIIDLFKERKEINEFDISTEENQRQLVNQYYKDVLKWKPERIKRQLDLLSAEEGALEDESTQIKNHYEENFKVQAQELKQRQAAERAAYEQEQTRRKTAFETSIKTAIQDYGVDEERKKAIENSLFKYKKLQDGTQVNDFYLKFAEWQNDPKKYVELVEFITNYDNYQKRKEIEQGNKAVDKTFKFVKGNQAVSKNTGSKHSEPEKQAKQKGTNFSLIFKTK